MVTKTVSSKVRVRTIERNLESRSRQDDVRGVKRNKAGQVVQVDLKSGKSIKRTRVEEAQLSDVDPRTGARIKKNTNVKVTEVAQAVPKGETVVTVQKTSIGARIGGTVNLEDVKDAKETRVVTVVDAKTKTPIRGRVEIEPKQPKQPTLTLAALGADPSVKGRVSEGITKKFEDPFFAKAYQDVKKEDAAIQSFGLTRPEVGQLVNDGKLTEKQRDLGIKEREVEIFGKSSGKSNLVRPFGLTIAKSPKGIITKQGYSELEGQGGLKVFESSGVTTTKDRIGGTLLGTYSLFLTETLGFIETSAKKAKNRPTGNIRPSEYIKEQASLTVIEKTAGAGRVGIEGLTNAAGLGEIKKTPQVREVKTAIDVGMVSAAVLVPVAGLSRTLVRSARISGRQAITKPVSSYKLAKQSFTPGKFTIGKSTGTSSFDDVAKLSSRTNPSVATGTSKRIFVETGKVKTPFTVEVVSGKTRGVVSVGGELTQRSAVIGKNTKGLIFANTKGQIPQYVTKSGKVVSTSFSRSKVLPVKATTSYAVTSPATQTQNIFSIQAKANRKVIDTQTFNKPVQGYYNQADDFIVDVQTQARGGTQRSRFELTGKESGKYIREPTPGARVKIGGKEYALDPTDINDVRRSVPVYEERSVLAMDGFQPQATRRVVSKGNIQSQRNFQISEITSTGEFGTGLKPVGTSRSQGSTLFVSDDIMTTVPKQQINEIASINTGQKNLRISARGRTQFARQEVTPGLQGSNIPDLSGKPTIKRLKSPFEGGSTVPVDTFDDIFKGIKRTPKTGGGLRFGVGVISAQKVGFGTGIGSPTTQKSSQIQIQQQFQTQKLKTSQSQIQTQRSFDIGTTPQIQDPTPIIGGGFGEGIGTAGIIGAVPFGFNFPSDSKGARGRSKSKIKGKRLNLISSIFK